MRKTLEIQVMTGIEGCWKELACAIIGKCFECRDDYELRLKGRYIHTKRKMYEFDFNCDTCLITDLDMRYLCERIKKMKETLV